MNRHFTRVLGLMLTAIAWLFFATNITSVACENISCMLTEIGRLQPLFNVSIGIAFLLIAMAVEWNSILNHVRIQKMSLCDVEHTHPRLPRKAEIAIAGLFSLSLVILFVQFILTVYAMAFTLSTSTSETKDTKQVIMSDVDGDGDLDYIALNATASHDHDVYLNDGTGTFSQGSTEAHANTFTAADAGDIDGDGDIDVIAYDVSTLLRKYTNDGTGNFTPTSFGVFPTPPTDLKLTDVDNDGDLDIVQGNSSAVTNGVFINDGTGVFTAVASTLPPLTFIVAAEINSDGYSDLLITDPSGNFKAYLNSGTGAFVQSYLTVLGANGPMTTGDFDGDGDIDAALSNTSHQIVVNLNNGVGTSFAAAGAAVASNLNSVRSIAAGDIDNDGDLDLIVSGGSTAGGARLFLNDGAGVVTENGVATETTDSTYGVAIADIDSDGDLDYVRGNDGAGVGAANRHYKSDQAATSANTAPTAPSAAAFTGALVSPSPKSPSTTADDSGVGSVSWSATSNAVASDDSYASAGFGAPSSISHYLKVTNFRFNIPSSATILGIKAEVEKKATGGVTDYAVRIVKGGTIGSTDKSAVGAWSTPLDATVTYGGSSDLWGETWSASDINGSTFGFAIAGQDNGVGGSTASVDHIRITVYYTMATIRLSWGSGSDSQTATKLLQYQLQAGTTSNSHTLVSSKTASPDWVRRLVPNGQSRTQVLRNVPCGNTYYWSVAAVDTGFKSSRSGQATFTLDASCGVTFTAGGSTTTSSAGGGTLWRIPQPAEPVIEYGHISVSAFEDINGNGVKDLREKNGFAGLVITASGSTASGVSVVQTALLSKSGEAAFELEKSSASGYVLSIDTGSLVLSNYQLLSISPSSSVVIRRDSHDSVIFAFRRRALLDYVPCLSIAPAREGERAFSDAFTLLERLEDTYSQRVMDGIGLKGTLVSRSEFLTLLQRTQCIPLLASPMEILSQAARTPLVDLPVIVPSRNATLLYSLLAAGLPASRVTAKGAAADLSAPVTRGEAALLLSAAMKLKTPPLSGSAAVLPIDLSLDDPATPSFVALRSIGVLPQSFLEVFGRNQGIDPLEMPILFGRAAFRAGHISLLPVVFDESSLDANHAAAPEAAPAFIDALPAFSLGECLQSNSERQSAIAFTDLLPDDPLEHDVRSLLAFGTNNGNDKTLWLLAGTKKPTEFGISKGSTKIFLDEPVSLFETLRTLLILRCLPPPTAKEALPALQKSIEGSAGSRVARDFLAGLPRDTSFVSRVFYRAQDHEREFDLSLFTYAPHLLQKEPRTPDTGLSVEEASDLLASGLLNLLVHETVLTPQQAEQKAGDLSFALKHFFLEGSDLAFARTTPFTRRMLLEFLSTVILRPDAEPSESSLGEVWWKRIEG